MDIDWFTLIAQIVNFLVLVALLKRFLYKPIINAMKEREAKIASRLEEAEEKRKAAAQEAQSYREKRSELEDQRQDMLARAAEEAEARRRELTRKAREQADALQARWQEAIEREKGSFLSDLRERAGRETYAIARRALKDLANADLEQHMIEVFIERLREAPPEVREGLAESREPLVARSAFEIPEEARQRIGEVVGERIADDARLRFETAQDLICGIELRAGGRSLAWSLDSYLEALEERLTRALAEGAEG